MEPADTRPTKPLGQTLFEGKTLLRKSRAQETQIKKLALLVSGGSFFKEVYLRVNRDGRMWYTTQGSTIKPVKFAGVLYKVSRSVELTSYPPRLGGVSRQLVPVGLTYSFRCKQSAASGIIGRVREQRYGRVCPEFIQLCI